jgi:2-polyprenyl-6-methoxyphenol hydroxylase-like FAD-dependent oxidoreductase
MSTAWDVIVVGARVAGAATALALARAGMRVLCVDRGAYGSDTLSTHALLRPGVMALSHLGLRGELAAAGTPLLHATTFDYGDGDRVTVPIKPSPGAAALIAPRRTVLDRLLVDAARRAGAVVEFGGRVTGVLEDPAGRACGVSVTAAGGVRRTERAALVVGADGRSSAVARAVGSAELWRGRHATTFLYGYWPSEENAGYEWFYRPGVAAGMIPTNGGDTCVFVGGPAGLVEPLVRGHGATEALGVLAGRMGLGSRVRPDRRTSAVVVARGLPPSYLRRAVGPGWALVGDAGSWLDPMSTHGMTAALRDAQLLSSVIRSAPAPGPRQDWALADYQDARDHLTRPMLGPADEIASFAWSRDRVQVVLRALAAAMADEVDAMAAPAPAA